MKCREHLKPIARKLSVVNAMNVSGVRSCDILSQQTRLRTQESTCTILVLVSGMFPFNC